MSGISLADIFKKRKFVTVATSDKNCEPNGVPKFFVKYEKPYAYLIDSSFAKTIHNLEINPRASLSLMDYDNLEAYRANGSVELIREGKEYKQIAKEVEKRTIQLSAERVIEGARTGKRHEHFELEIPDKFIVIKVKIEEIVKIAARGDFFKENS
jgi:predicted pyridoxine 5'-phosphate oxidase superfamily flavin-nucleotide-binding protein